MKEQNLQNDPVKSPEIQEMILSNRIGIISAELAKRLDIAPVRYNYSTKARLVPICTIRQPGFISTVISILRMNSCENTRIKFKY